MSIHLMSLMRQGLCELEGILKNHHLELSEFAQGFNAYPAPSRLKSLIHIVNQILIGPERYQRRDTLFQSFCPMP